ncbi:MAG: tRNA-specific adenosine deaminase, partial [Candidatus Melainabacteria bacterium HGW-Melainabacteria-1]
IAAAGNTCQADNNPLAHAEMQVLTRAHTQLAQQDFRNACLFVTLEPCPMCMGAILHSHLGQLVYGASNLKWGCCGTVIDFHSLFPGEAITILGGISEAECSELLASFFAGLR